MHKCWRLPRQALRAVDPQNKVLFGGVAWEYWDGIGAGFDKWFPDEVNHYFASKGEGGYSYFDVMNYHYYDRIGYYLWGNNPVNKAIALNQTFPELQGKPFVITELGEPWAQIPPDPNLQPPYSDDSTTNALIRSMTQMMAAPSQGITFLSGDWYTYDFFLEYAGQVGESKNGLQWFPRTNIPLPLPLSASSTASYRYWGLLNQDGSPRYYNPSLPNGQTQGEYTTYETISNELTGATYESPVTDNPNIEGYRFAMPDGTARVVLWSKSGSVNYSFPGNRLQWVDKYRYTDLRC